MTTQLKERPVIFTAEEVKAVLAGDKTQHRTPILTGSEINEGFDWDHDTQLGRAVFTKEIDDERQEILLRSCPFGDVGDRLWVQEEHRPIGWSFDDGDVKIQYQDGKDSRCEIQTWEEVELNPNDDYLIAICDELINRNVPMKEGTDFFDMEDESNLPHWRSAGVMPKFASRALLEITSIRIEQVQKTSHSDAVAEGVHHFSIYARLRDQPLSVAQIVFSRHWDDKYQDDHVIWEDNPWVWVVEFKKVDD